MAHNRFVERYNRAVELLTAGRLAAAAREVKAALEDAPLPADAEQAEALLRDIRERAASTR